MANVSGIAIVIKAFLPTGKTLDEQFAALSIVKDAHASGNYASLLAAAQIDEVKTEQKVRRVEDVAEPATLPQAAHAAPEEAVNGVAHIESGEPSNFEDGIDEPRVNPEDDDPFSGDPLDQPVASAPEPDEPAPKRIRAKA